MAITKGDILFDYVLGTICGLCAFLFNKHWLSQRIYSYLKWAFPVVMLVPFVPDFICPKEIKLIAAWEFGFQLFTEGGSELPISDTLFSIVCKLPHHLTVLCSDSHIEIVGYSICWAAHAFAYRPYLGMNNVKKIFICGNHVPIAVVISLCYRYFIGGECDEGFILSFAVAVQMLLYRYVVMTCKYAPYWPFTIPWIYEIVQKVIKPILCFMAAGFLLYALI